MVLVIHFGEYQKIYSQDCSCYSRAGNLIRRLDAAGSGISIGYDLAGRRTEAVTMGGSTHKWRYDAMGNVNEITDGAGITHDN